MKECYDYIPIEYLKDSTIVGLANNFEISFKTKKAKFFEIINNLILDPKLKIHLTQRIETKNTLYYGYIEEQILGSIPVLNENK